MSVYDKKTGSNAMDDKRLLQALVNSVGGPKSRRKHKPRFDMQQRVSFGKRVDSLMPSNLYFYYVDDNTCSAHYHINKKPLTASDCGQVEMLMGLKKGTCYVIGYWMRLKATENMCREWNDVACNVKSGYSQVHAHIQWLMQKILHEYETTYEELLSQQQIRGMYYVKIRDVRSPVVVKSCGVENTCENTMHSNKRARTVDAMHRIDARVLPKAFSAQLQPSICYPYDENVDVMELASGVVPSCAQEVVTVMDVREENTETKHDEIVLNTNNDKIDVSQCDNAKVYISCSE